MQAAHKSRQSKDGGGSDGGAIGNLRSSLGGAAGVADIPKMPRIQSVLPVSPDVVPAHILGSKQVCASHRLSSSSDTQCSGMYPKPYCTGGGGAPAPTTKAMNNYMGIGIDAKVALEFHQMRDQVRLGQSALLLQELL